MTLSWLLLPRDFTLLTKHDLETSESWSAVPNVTAVEDQLTVTLPRASNRQFFKLEESPLIPSGYCVPIFWFSIFYGLDAEISPGPSTTINGPVHCNSNLYVTPTISLTFQKRVTVGNAIYTNGAPGSPITGSTGTVTYLGGRRSGVNPLTLSIGADAARQIVEMPPPGEDLTSEIAKMRFYNKADMIVVMRDSGVTVTSGWYDNFATIIGPNHYTNFLSTNVTFFNKRENKTIRAIQIDVGKLRAWNSNGFLRSIFPAGDIRCIYVADLTTQTSGTESGVRLMNGQTILPKGLTVATPNPLYIVGHYNCPNTPHLGTTNTTATLPAALVADAITILSSNWNDANSTRLLSGRIATSTTVNAALLAGIVPTVAGSYSGGVENLPRLLETWGSSRTFTYNGSMVVLFGSAYATAPWQGTTGPGIYDPPRRQWSFDSNFRNVNKLPPGTPMVGVLAPAE